MKFQTVIITSGDHEIRLDRFFKRHHKNISFSTIAKLIRKKDIKLNGKRVDVSTKISQGDKLSYPIFEDTSSDTSVVHTPAKYIKLIQDSLLFEDDDIIVINKPMGLAVQGGSKIRYSVDDLSIHLRGSHGEKPKLVHRIDKSTSGLLVLAKRSSIAASLAKVIKNRNFYKTYLAICLNVPKILNGKIDLPIKKNLNSKGNYEKVESDADGKPAITYYEVLDKASNKYCLIKAQILTGRTHQIRVHLSHIGCPIIGDDKHGYATEISDSFEDNLYLHAYKLEFNLNDKEYSFKAPLPIYFSDALDNFGLNVN